MLSGLNLKSRRVGPDTIVTPPALVPLSLIMPTAAATGASTNVKCSKLWSCNPPSVATAGSNLIICLEIKVCNRVTKTLRISLQY